MKPAAIEASGLSKIFPGDIIALNAFDFTVPPGVVYGLMGCNGSGKTTALRLLLGLLKPSSGVARVLGADFWDAPRSVRSRVAYVAQSQQLPSGLTLEELSHCLRKCHQRWDPAHARVLARRWDLAWKRPLGCLSNGEQRKAAILVAFASRPEVLVLDEPASGFDLVARRQLIDEVVDAITQSDGCTVLLSTHLIADLERIAEHVGVLERGRMALSVRLEDLLNQSRRVQVIFDEDGPPAEFAIPGALMSRRTGSVVTALVRWPHGGELETLRASINARVEVFPTGLEEIFLELFGQTYQGSGSESEHKPIGNGALEML